MIEMIQFFTSPGSAIVFGVITTFFVGVIASVVARGNIKTMKSKA